MNRSPIVRQIAPGRVAGSTLAVLGTALVSAPAWAACEFSLGYSPASSPVPGLTVASVAVLGATLGALAWSKRSRMAGAGRKFLLLAAWSSTGLLAVQTGDGLVQAVNAAPPYAFSNPAGGTVADSNLPDSTTSVSVSNTSGVPVRIVSNSNANAPGSCQPGAVIAPNGSCTTNALCPEPGGGTGGGI